MSFRVNSKQFLKNYNKLWEKVEKLMKIDFETKPVYGYDDKYIKTKINIYASSIITNFHNKKMPKGKAPCKYLSIIMLDSVIKANKKYYPQTFLEECKYQIVTLMMKQNLILIMMNIANNFLKVSKYNKSLHLLD